MLLASLYEYIVVVVAVDSGVFDREQKRSPLGPLLLSVSLVVVVGVNR